MSLELIAVLLLVLAAEFVNGWTDSPNAIATVVSTKVLSPRKAVLMATAFNIIGALSGTAVAATIGKGIVEISAINLSTVGAAMVSIVIWSALAARMGIPTSESHALVSGLAGAALATAGPQALLWAGWKKILIGLVFSTFLGFAISLAFAKLVVALFSASSPARAGKNFNRLQIASAGFMAFNHGSNDGQKFAGVFAMALVLGGMQSRFAVPSWVILICAVIMGLGTLTGGWRIIRKIGMTMVELKSWQGFCAESAAGMTILTASHFGIPLSTTHTINTAIMGVGASRGFSSVRWGIARDVVAAWILTFPVCAGISFIVSLLVRYLSGMLG